MVTQTMGSQGVGEASMSKMLSLSRQGSLYSLTLDEVEHQLGNLGKPLSSMNLDELLRSVWTAEAHRSQGPGGRLDIGASGSCLNRQLSLTLSRDLSRKTVDEILREIQRGKKNDNRERNQDGENVLGEMTLEDFLVHAGIVLDYPNGNHASGHLSEQQAGVSNHAHWMQYQLLSQQQQQHNMMTVFMPGHHVQEPISVGGVGPDSAYIENVTLASSPITGMLSETQALGRKRVAPGDVVEKTVERRQKRMIKNRESAARSRARRQAYTHELENKVSRLEEENERLRRMREVEKSLPCVPPPQPKCQLRRTSSAPL